MMNERKSDELLDARLRAFLTQRAEEIAPTALPVDVVGARLAYRVRTARPWPSWWAAAPAGVRVAIVFGLLLVALAVLALAAARPPAPLANGPIAFIDKPSVVLIGADGTGRHALTTVQTPDPGAFCCSAMYSPDGSRLLTATASSVDVMNGDGADRAELVRGVGIGYPAWSPDGRHVAVSMAVAGHSQAFVIDIASGAVLQVANGLAFASGPSWAHDGRRIAVAGALSSAGPQAVFVVASDGTGLHQVGPDIPAGFAITDPGVVWSPDDRSLAVGVRSDATGAAGIDVFATDGSGLRALLPANLQGQAPIWSPDGTWIAFGGWQTGGSGITDLYVIRPDGSGARRLAADVSAFSPFDYAWSPDGAVIAFADQSKASSTVNADLRVIRPDGSGGRLLAAGQVNGTIAWPPVWR